MTAPGNPKTTIDENVDPLEAVIDRALASAINGRVTIRRVLEAWGDRSYGPLFILLGFVASTPLAIMPGASALIGVVIAFLAVQMIFGARYPWMPKRMLSLSVSEKSLNTVREKAAPTLKFLDRLITRRLTILTNVFTRRLAACVVLLLSLVMIPLDAIPFAVAAPSWGVAIIGVAITARDGLLMAIALATAAGIGYFAYLLLT